MSKLKQTLFSLKDSDRKIIEEKLKTQDQQIDQLKQQLEALMLEISKQEVEQHKPAYCTLAGTDCTYMGKIEELEKQLAEKDKEIEEILSSKKHFKTCAENMLDVLKTINSVLPKPQENGLNYKKVADDVVVLIKEKDKEIKELNKTLEMCKHIERYDIGEMFKENVKLIIEKRQFAIQELEKVKNYCDEQFSSWENNNFNETYDNKDVSQAYFDVSCAIQDKIQELKG